MCFIVMLCIFALSLLPFVLFPKCNHHYENVTEKLRILQKINRIVTGLLLTGGDFAVYHKEKRIGGIL